MYFTINTDYIYLASMRLESITDTTVQLSRIDFFS